MKYVVAFIFIFLANLASAHSGGLDKNGCHSGSQNYHCHKKINKSELPKPGAILEGRVTHVRDGDTIEVAQIPIRLAALDCPEVGSIAGDLAKSVAQEFLGSQAICFLTGAKSYDRFVAYCEIRGRDFGESLMRETNCKAWKKFDVWNRY